MSNNKMLNMSTYLVRQGLLAIIGISIGLAIGGVTGFSSVFIAQNTKIHEFNLNISQESWIASSSLLLLPPICLMAGIIMEKLGRKSTLIISELLGVLSWIMIYFSSDYTTILIPRLLIGIQMGLEYPTFITFVGEISFPKYRTLFLPCVTVGGTFGTFLCQYLGEYLSWRTVAIVFATFPLCNLIILSFIKDSYVTQLDRNNIDKARHFFEWYRGKSSETKHDFEEIITDKNKRIRNNFIDIIRMCLQKSFLIPFGITTIVYLANESTGSQAVTFYTSQIVSVINNEPVFLFYAVLAVNIIRIVAVILSAFLVKISTVRFILISTGYCLGISLIFLALFMYLSELYVGESIFPILALITLVVNTVLFNLGLGPLPSVVCGEMFPEATRSIGGSVSAALSFAILFIVVKFVPELLNSIGPFWVFSIFGLSTLFCISISHLVLPNTKNKTLQEINIMYQKKDETCGVV